MNRLAMRTVLRRRAQDTADTPELTDSEWNDLLNLAVLDIQDEILIIEPGAFVSVDTFDQVSGQDNYIQPAGFRYEYELAILDASEPTGWRALPRMHWRYTKRRASSSQVAYAILGRYFYLSPVPSANVDEGLRLVWVYSLSMNADTDVCQLPLSLHDTVVDMALLKYLSETSDTEAQDRAEARIARKMEKLPFHIRRSKVPITVGIEHGDALRRNRLTRDVYQS